MIPDVFTIQSHKGRYEVRFAPLFEGLTENLPQQSHLIIDTRVAELYSQPLKRALSGPSVLRIDATEDNKSLERIPAYMESLLANGLKRNHTLIAVGGGIIQDITAFIAGTLMRGLPWTLYPTTLLAQADSCVGSKSSINIGKYKNQVGTFTPPTRILICPEVLKTLADAEIHSGIGEIIKVHLLAGWKEFDRLKEFYPRLLKDDVALKTAIYQSLEIKKPFVEQDEFDQDRRLLLNYGHTFGHAIESATGFAIPHGIAVTLGMEMANFLSVKLGLMAAEDNARIQPLLALNSKAFRHVPIPEQHFFEALSRDKKNTSAKLTLILTRGPGHMFREGYSPEEPLLDWCREFLRSLPT